MAQDDSIFGQLFGKNGTFDKVFGPYKAPKVEQVGQIRIALNSQHFLDLVKGRVLNFNAGDQKISVCLDDIGFEVMRVMLGAAEKENVVNNNMVR